MHCVVFWGVGVNRLTQRVACLPLGLQHIFAVIVRLHRGVDNTVLNLFICLKIYSHVRNLTRLEIVFLENKKRESFAITEEDLSKLKRFIPDDPNEEGKLQAGKEAKYSTRSIHQDQWCPLCGHSPAFTIVNGSFYAAYCCQVVSGDYLTDHDQNPIDSA